MAKLKRVSVLKFAILRAGTLGFVGMICGTLYSFGGFFYELFTGTLNAGTIMAFFALIGMPAIFGSFGFAAGIIEAALYNVWARRSGGIEVEVGPTR